MTLAQYQLRDKEDLEEQTHRRSLGSLFHHKFSAWSSPPGHRWSCTETKVPIRSRRDTSSRCNSPSPLSPPYTDHRVHALPPRQVPCTPSTSDVSLPHTWRYTCPIWTTCPRSPASWVEDTCPPSGHSPHRGSHTWSRQWCRRGHPRCWQMDHSYTPGSSQSNPK